MRRQRWHLPNAAGLTLVAALMVGACSYLPQLGQPHSISQTQGLPALRHLDWGFTALAHPA
jgi:hypothetical protein